MKFKTYLRTVVGELPLDGELFTFDKEGYWTYSHNRYIYYNLRLQDYEYIAYYIEYKLYCYVRDLKPETIASEFVIV